MRQDFFGTNALRFLRMLDDDDVKSDTATRRRLRAWYGDLPAPAWL